MKYIFRIPTFLILALCGVNSLLTMEQTLDCDFTIPIDNAPDGPDCTFSETFNPVNEFQGTTWTVRMPEDYQSRYSEQNDNNVPFEAQQTDNFHNEMARDNALDSHKETVKNDAATRNSEQDYQHRTRNEPHQNSEPVPSKPEYPLTDTIDHLENKLQSTQGIQALEHRLHQIKYEQSGFQLFTNSELTKEANFIRMALDGTITQLLNDIQHGDVHISQRAYGRLREAWPYEYRGSFLAPREISGAEYRLMRLVGGDIMQQAERCLFSRLDYIKVHGDRIYGEIAAYQASRERTASQGKIQQLKKEEHELAKALRDKRNYGDFRMKARLFILQSILSDPTMQSYAVIAYSPLPQAKQEMRYTEQQIFEHFAKQGITDPVEINAMLPESIFRETLANMHRLMEARPDFQEEQFAVEHITHLYSESVLFETITENRDLLEVYKAHNFGNIERIETRIVTLNQIAQNNIKLTHETYILTDNAVTLLIREGIDHRPYLQCTGNQLQQFNHQDCINIVEQLALPNQDVLVREYMSSMLHFVDAAVELNKANSPVEAISLTDICWSIFDCAQAACEGIIDGAVGSLINNPIETVACVVAPYHVLAYQLGKVAVNLADIGLTALMDEELGKQRLAEYIRPITDCIDAISDKEFRLRDGVKITAYVATQVVAQGKLYAGLKKFLKTTKRRAKNFLKSNPMATAEQYLVTPDGMLLKASGGPGKNGPSLKDMGGKGPKNAQPKGNSNVAKTRKINSMTKQEFFKRPDIKSNFEKCRNGIYKRRPNAKGLDKDIEYLDWDHLHNDVEAYNSSKKHLGSLDPETLEMYKGPVPYRDIKQNF